MSLDEFNEELEEFKLDLINSEIYKEYIIFSCVFRELHI